MNTGNAHTVVRPGAYSALALIGSAFISFGFLSCVVQAGGSEQPKIELPATYREWKLISVAREAGSLNDIRAVLGNYAAFKAYLDGKQALPNGAMIARLAYEYTSSTQNNKVFGREQSYVAGLPTNIQIMVKDSKKFSSTGGWGYAQVPDSKAQNSVDQAAASKCFACHTAVKEHDFLFTRFAS